MEEQEYNEQNNEQYYDQEDENSNKKEEDKKKGIIITVIVFVVLLLLILGFNFYLTHLMPSYMLSQGKKYLEAGEYDKAYKMFKSAEDALPLSNEPVYLRAVALSKMKPTFQVQKELHEISQLDDCDEASDYAENYLSSLRNELDNKIGPNFIDNVLYEGKLVRWNNAAPITYAMTNNIPVPEYYYDSVRKAFQNWQRATNGLITFNEISDISKAKINVIFTNDVPEDRVYDPEQSGNVIPTIKDAELIRMDINLKNADLNGNQYNSDSLTELAQHEIGHALGLWGHSAYDGDVMAYHDDYINEYSTLKPLSHRDINTLMFVYNMIPDVIDEALSNEQMQDMYYHNILTTYPGVNFEFEVQRLLSQLRNDRRNIALWVDIAINYAYKKLYERSNYILNRVLPLTYSDIENEQVVLYNLAANYYKMRQYKTSEKYLVLATNIKDDLDTQILEAFLDFRLDRIDLAKAKLIQLNKVYPDHIEIALKLAEVYYKLQDRDKEKTVINNLLKNNPKAINDRRVRKYRQGVAIGEKR